MQQVSIPAVIMCDADHVLALQVITLDRGLGSDEMDAYCASYSMMGICVGLTVVVRPRTLIKTRLTAYPTDGRLPAVILRVHQLHDSCHSLVQPV